MNIESEIFGSPALHPIGDLAGVRPAKALMLRD
jgi:hypothetical protein